MQTILQIVERAGGWHPGLWLKIDNAPFMELVIEAVDESGPCGFPALSVTHYGEQNGDAMRDPEMLFELEPEGGLNPFYYRNDYVGTEQWSRYVTDGQYHSRRELFLQHVSFARVWDRNLQSQGYLGAFRPTEHIRGKTLLPFPTERRDEGPVSSLHNLDPDNRSRRAPEMQNSSAFQIIAIDQIHESDINPRQTFEESKLQELAESLRQHGLIQPITVRPHEGSFEIVAGARRFRAAQLAELFSLPARIVELTDGQALEWALVENSQRVDVYPYEEARGFQRLLDLHGYDVAALVEKSGKSASHIYARLSLLQLIPEVAEAFTQERITASHANLKHRHDDPRIALRRHSLTASYLRLARFREGSNSKGALRGTPADMGFPPVWRSHRLVCPTGPSDHEAPALPSTARPSTGNSFLEHQEVHPSAIAVMWDIRERYHLRTELRSIPFLPGYVALYRRSL